jgi:hypothetical protein
MPQGQIGSWFGPDVPALRPIHDPIAGCHAKADWVQA